MDSRNLRQFRLASRSEANRRIYNSLCDLGAIPLRPLCEVFLFLRESQCASFICTGEATSLS